jgi:protein-S-isoprenylcysteine O-methyltransferase Ste14
LIALGSGRSFAGVSPTRGLLDVRPALGDLFVVLTAVLVVEFVLLVYILVSSFKRRSAGADQQKASNSSWQRLLAILAPLLLIAVFAAAVARRGTHATITPISLGPPPTLLPLGGGTGSGSPLVVHWWILGGIALFGLVALVVALVLRRRRPRETTPATAQSERRELLAAVDASIEELDDDSDPRRAVINAYASMEQVLSQHGLPRKPSETSLEYLARWAGALQVGRAASEGLAGLYELARFSLHLIDDEMRREAKTALSVLRRELTDEPA